MLDSTNLITVVSTYNVTFIRRITEWKIWMTDGFLGQNTAKRDESFHFWME